MFPVFVHVFFGHPLEFLNEIHQIVEDPAHDLPCTRGALAPNGAATRVDFRHGSRS